RLKEVDAVMVGMGWTGSILARELTKAGLTVVGLERGEDLTPRENFALPAVRDELRYSYRLELIQDPALETVTFRHRPSEPALPMRRFGSFLPGNSVGGAANHWGGQHWRYLPSDHLTRSRIVGRYGANAIPDDMPIQDWAMTYDELEPYYDKFDKLCGVSGKAGNLRGERIEGGNIFEGPRSSEYPRPPLIMTESGLMFAKAAKELGYHPFPQPASNASRPYVNSEGLRLLRTKRLQGKSQGGAAGLCASGAALRTEILAAFPLLGQPAELRQNRQEGDGRHLHGHAHRRGIRAARRDRGAFSLRLRQHLASSHLRHRGTL